MDGEIPCETMTWYSGMPYAEALDVYKCNKVRVDEFMYNLHEASNGEKEAVVANVIRLLAQYYEDIENYNKLVELRDYVFDNEADLDGVANKILDMIDLYNYLVYLRYNQNESFVTGQEYMNDGMTADNWDEFLDMVGYDAAESDV